MSKKHLLRRMVYSFLFLLLLGLVVGWFQVGRLESRATAYAQSGRDAIKLLGQFSDAVTSGSREDLMACYAPSFSASAQATWSASPGEEPDGAVILDWLPGSGDVTLDRDRIVDFTQTWLKGFSALERVRFKLASVEKADKQEMIIRSVLWVRGQDPNGAFKESKARFRLHLMHTPQGLAIADQQLLFGETVLGEGKGFQDVAQEKGIHFRAQMNPIYTTPEWELKYFGIFKYAAAGVSAADYDGDGWDDLFFADGARAVLYRNVRGESFQDVTAEAGLPLDLAGFNLAIFGDWNNDGHNDLFLGGLTTPSRFFRNTGNGGYEEVTDRTAGISPLVATAAAADYDNDGDLDLYLGRYLDPRIDLPTTLFYTRNGAGNTLLRNDGDFRFTDVTEEAGVREGGLTLGISWGDYDEDGDADMYVANDFGRNALLRNEGNGTFSDVTMQSGTLDFGFGMSATFGDVDNDGDLDLYVSNVNSAQRWYGQAATLYSYILNSTRQGTIRGDLSLYKEIWNFTGRGWDQYGDRMVKGNSLMLNDGNGTFTDVAEAANANPFGWYWGSTMFDYDNDGLLDLYAANGWISGKVVDDY